MSDSNPIWKQTLASVLAGVALLAIGWVLGLLPAIWSWVVGAARELGDALQAPITIARWHPIALAAVIGIMWWGIRRRDRRVHPPSQPVRTQAPRRDEPLTELEQVILRALAAADGAWVTIQDFSERLHTPRLLVEQALSKLYSRGLLLDNYSSMGVAFRLNDDGRDLVIKLGYVNPSPFNV